jgi:hypothetical protein
MTWPGCVRAGMERNLGWPSGCNQARTLLGKQLITILAKTALR